MEIWFYHLQSQPLERALPALVAKAVARGWRVVVQLVDDLRVKVMDDWLWTFSPESFLPHATDRDGRPERQPVILTSGGDNANAAALRILVGGAELPAGLDGYERLIILFDGGNTAELATAREQWSAIKARGLAPTYWQQTDAGGWTRRL